jgi:predicted nucleic acid-binding protein
LEWVNRLEGTIVGLDTSPLIYFVEEHPRYMDVVQPFFESVHHGGITVVTSVITLLEILVHPLREGATGLANQYRQILLDSTDIQCIPVTHEIASSAAQLRAEYNFRTPDAIQLSTAITAGATAFLTNDARLSNIPGITILVIDHL